MDKWGRDLGESPLLSLEEKGEIVAAFYEGFKRQDQALGYVRAFHGMMSVLPKGLETLEVCLPFDLISELKNSRFGELAKMSETQTIEHYKNELDKFVCPVTQIKF
jgi:hypothetical protein